MRSLTGAALAALLALSLAPVVHAQSAQAGVRAEEAMSSGEVKKIDRSAGKLTIRHGPLANLGMDGMTMAFRVIDPGMLDGLNVGDRIRFVAEKPNGQLTVTKLERLN